MSFGLSRGKSLITSGVGFSLADLPPLDSGPLDPRSFFFPHVVSPPAAAHISSPHLSPLLQPPLEIEIGSGKGTFLIQHAPRHPQALFLGIEWAAEFFRYAADRVRRHDLANVKLLHADAVEFIKFRLPPSVASTLHIYFSDPWPKSRHHKRRVIQDDSLFHFHRILQPHGQVHLVTDHPDLWAWYEDHAARHASLFSRSDFLGSPSASQGEFVGTNFERKYQREGRTFHAMTLERI